MRPWSRATVEQYRRLTLCAHATTPTKTELMTYAVFDDTCGNLIQITEG